MILLLLWHVPRVATSWWLRVVQVLLRVLMASWLSHTTSVIVVHSASTLPLIIIVIAKEIVVGPIMQDESDCRQEHYKDGDVAWPAFPLTLGFIGHVLILWLLLLLFRLRGLWLHNFLRHFSFILESERDRSLEPSVRVCQHNACLEVLIDLCGHNQSQVVVIWVFTFASDFRLDLHIILVLIINLHVEITWTENLNLLGSLWPCEFHAILKLLFDFDLTEKLHFKLRYLVWVQRQARSWHHGECIHWHLDEARHRLRISIFLISQVAEETFQVWYFALCRHEVRLITSTQNADILSDQSYSIILHRWHHFFIIFTQLQFDSHS